MIQLVSNLLSLKYCKDGARVVIAAKTTTAHPTLPGTIYTAAQEIEAVGGQALAIPVDIRYEDQITRAVNETLDTFGLVMFQGFVKLIIYAKLTNYNS